MNSRLLVIALLASNLACAGPPVGPNGVEGELRDRFERLNAQDWQELFFDSGTNDWRDRWFLDGLKATVSNGEAGMNFSAGPVPRENASHAVLWTQQSFLGDLKIEYEYTRTDEANQYVNILYIQATGSGEEGKAPDIAEWADQRTVPAMSAYWGNMHTYHISYAAYGREPVTDDYDYIRARRYRPDIMPKKNGPIFEPDVFERTGLFAPGVPHRITVIKQADELFMMIRNADKEYLAHWDTTGQPPVIEGRIGLRHMYTRSARYRDFRVSVRK
ncbi:MAG: YesU family protein [Gammaproteobacteria bacterium]|nr:YesU family protein [Gammaproteobacteria bacterium]